MNRLKSIVMAGGASITLAAAAHAADLPTTKGAPPPAPATVGSCTSFQDFLTTACPLTYYGITLYGTVDVGYGWEKFGAPWNPLEHTGDDYLISKPGRPNIWNLRPQRAEPVEHRRERSASISRPAGRSSDRWKPVTIRTRSTWRTASGRSAKTICFPSISVVEPGFQPRRPVGQLAGIRGNQQHHVRHAHLRP